MVIDMDSVSIRGRSQLNGTIRIQGSKNAVLPILAATLLIKEPCYIENCPDILDVYHSLQLLREMGTFINWNKQGLRLCNRVIHPERMTLSLMNRMRSSITLAGPLLSRCHEIRIGNPGGCVIGERPIDIHLDAFKRMGAQIHQNSHYIYLKSERLKGVEHQLPFASVGATENIIMAAVLAEGKTIIRHAAKEPEIVALCEFLNFAGACIKGAGTDTIDIEGVSALHGCKYQIPADRIVAGTYISAVLACGGRVILENAPWQDMEMILYYAKQMGLNIVLSTHGLLIEMRHRPYAISNLATDVHPGFPTDMQSLFMVPLCLAYGHSVVEENIFENRFHIVPELQKMGANVRIEDKKCYIFGVNHLHGANVKAAELRGAAALIIAGMAAEGESKMDGIQYLSRGYENFLEQLNGLGGMVALERNRSD